MPLKKKPLKAEQTHSQLRIIGGQWRSRKIDFPTVDGLRPTPDRVRETLFNWLQNTVPSAHCLDLFAGSGALGIEALSRGAQSCTFIDIDHLCCQALRTNLQKLQCESAEVRQTSALQWLNQISVNSTDKKFHVVFLDPPFNQDLCQQICQLLIDKQLLADDAYVYIETEPHANINIDWPLHREKISGQVHYRLYRV
ncbi:16S rRNA (guanine(966)-N(2))-methyltransferase RsmD [Gammaproteobacteria bacterium AS21]|jgi:16S rRNA (guanine966-N2)-methyltransferase